MAGKFEVYRDAAGRFRWRLKAGNGEPIASGEAYDTKSSALAATDAVQRAAAGASVEDLNSPASSPASTPTPTPTGSTGSTSAPVTPHPGVDHVVVLVQENHTTDNYFAGLAPWGVNVATDLPVEPNPPVTDQPHDRSAYYQWLTTGKATRAAFDPLSVALLLLPGVDRGVPGEPLRGVRYKLDSEPPDDRGWAEPHDAEPTPHQPTGLGTSPPSPGPRRTTA